jgi:hypothetical protein
MKYLSRGLYQEIFRFLMMTLRGMLFLFAIFLLLAPLPADADPLPAHRSLLFADNLEASLLFSGNP